MYESVWTCHGMRSRVSGKIRTPEEGSHIHAVSLFSFLPLLLKFEA